MRVGLDSTTPIRERQAFAPQIGGVVVAEGAEAFRRGLTSVVVRDVLGISGLA
jgi:hypothetical protein